MPGRTTVVGAVLLRDGRVLAARRSTPPVGLWEFPGGKVEPDETADRALVRELREELGVTVTVGPELGEAGHPWPISERLELRLFVVSATTDPVPGDSHDALRWLAADQLDEVGWLPSDRAALPAVRDLLVTTVLHD